MALQIQVEIDMVNPAPDVCAIGIQNFGTFYYHDGVSRPEIGDVLYLDPGLLSAVVGQSGYWIYLDIDPTNPSSNITVQLNDFGIIVDLFTCNPDNYGSFEWIGIGSDDSTEFCDVQPSASLWYVAPNIIPTLEGIILSGSYAFDNPLSAQSWAQELNNYTNPGGPGANPVPPLSIPSGLASSSIFGDTTTNPYLWNKNLLEWKAGIPCPTQIPQQLYSITLAKSVNHQDPTAAQFCTDVKAEVTYYYMYDQNSNLTLEDIAVNNIPIYFTSSGAYNGLSSAMVATNIFDDLTENDGYYVWVNDNNGVGFQWYGFDGSGALTTGNSIVAGGSCNMFQRPSGYGTELITSQDPFASEVFYAFWSCIPVVDNTLIYWPMYLVSGDHLNGQANHMTDFIDVLNSTGLNTFKNTPGTECMTYMHQIVALDINEAEVLLAQVAGYDAQTIQQQDQSYIGIFSNNTLSLRSDCDACAYLTPPGGIYGFGVIEGSVTPSFGPNTDLEKNYNLDNVSKPLLRTNPKLTTNVKLVANESDQIFIESIDATKELSAVEYKKFELNKTGSYAQDLQQFFARTKTTAEIMYATKREAGDLSVLDSYQQQIEETYQYGATANYSKLHDEDFRMFAPIWLDVNIPKMFVIFKVKNPIDTKGLSNLAADKLKKIQAILANAEIVKTFDLTRATALGTYIRNHVQEATFPKTPLTFSFEKGEKSSFNGIDLDKGGFTSKAEYMYEDFVKQDKPLIDANDFITDGFKRNKLAVANILNIEFLFNDPTSTDYTVNRYFGLYVDAIDSGTGLVSFASHGRLKLKDLESLTDSTIPYSAIPSSKMMTAAPTLGYAKLRETYFKIENNKFYDEANGNLLVVDSQNKIPSLLGTDKKGVSVDLTRTDDIGYDYVKINIAETPVVNDSIAMVNVKEEAYRIKFIKHIANTQVVIDDAHGHTITFNTGASIQDALDNFETAFAAPLLSFGAHFNLKREANAIVITEKKASLTDLKVSVQTANGNVIRISKIYTYSNIIKNRFYAAAPGALAKGTFSGNKFSQDGTTSDIAIALTAIINNAGEFKATNYLDNVYVETNVGGYRLMQHALLVDKSNNSQFVSVENLDLQNELDLADNVLLDWHTHYFKGGNSLQKSCIVNPETAAQIQIGDQLPTVYAGKYNKVVDIVDHVRDLKSGYKKLVLLDKSTIPSGETPLYEEAPVTMGLFSTYDIYDMNFDFYDTSNSDLKELKHETVANMAYEPYDNPQGLLTNQIFSDNFALSPEEYFSNLQPLLKEDKVNDETLEKIYSEYDRLKENYIATNATRSRVTPNINKWVLKDSMTVREQPYYLNANEAFGRTNFAPDLTVENRDRLAFTHEWFYMDRLPLYFRYDMVNDSFSYVDFINNLNSSTPFEITKDLFKNTDHDYFDRYMVVDGLEVASDSSGLASTEVGNFDITTFMKTVRQKKYSLVDGGDDLSFANTVFKGIKVFFKKRKEFQKENPSEFVKDTEFNGYRFSTLVKVNMSANSNSIEYDVIQNKKFGFVIFFITLNVSDVWSHDYINRKLLYELKHNIVQDLSGDNIYSDINLDGALALNITDFNGAGPFVVKGITHVDGTTTKFNTQLSIGQSKTYGRILIDLGLQSGIIYAVQVVEILSDSEITVKGIPVNVADPNDTLQTQYLTQAQLVNALYVYEEGGVDAHSKLLVNLSAGRVARMLNNNDGAINYLTIEVDGTETLNQFVLNFDSGKEIIKTANLVTVEDTKKPKSYALFKGVIGYNIEQGPTYYPFLIRHSGSYTVDLRPVVTFTDLYTHFKVNRDHATLNLTERTFEEGLYKHSLSSVTAIKIAKAYYKRYNRTGTSFNVGFIQDGGSHDGNWGLVKNHFYHKVNEINPSSVTKLTATAEDQPLYPLIGEVAIDKRDISVFRSSWDTNYYSRALAGGRSELVPGTFDAIEERSYMASTIMKYKADYELLQFTSEYVQTEEELDFILKNSNNTTDAVIFEDRERVVIDFYIQDAVYKRLRDEGVLATLARFIVPTDSIGDKTSLVDDAEDYVFKNLLGLYVIDFIRLYTRAHKEGQSTVVSSNTLAELTSGAFSPDGAFTYKLQNLTPLNFRLIYNKRLGYSYDIRPMVKIKS